MSNIADLKELSSSVEFWGTTTGFSSDRLCEILVFAVNSAQKLEAAERERDELLQRMANREIEMEEEKRLHKEGASMFRGQYDDLAAAMGWSYEVAERQKVSQLEYARQLNRRVIDLEAEIARRDAVAGEVSCQHKWINSQGRTESGWLCEKCGEYERPIAAQPAVLPPDITFESKGFVSLTSEDFAYNRALEDARKLGAPPAVLPDIDGYTHGLFPHAVEQLTRFRDDALALGAQQQKVVELPDIADCCLSPAWCSIAMQQITAALDAANVKCEVKK